MKIVKKYLILLLLVAGAFSKGNAHPYYLSLCQVIFNSETKSLEIQLKIFADDLILGLENAGHRHLFLGEERENPETDKYLYEYLKKALHFRVNDKEADYKFVGKETDQAAVWIYLEISDVEDLKSVGVECNLLTEVLETQSNLIQIQKGKAVRNLLLNKRNTCGTLSFQN